MEKYTPVVCILLHHASASLLAPCSPGIASPSRTVLPFARNDDVLSQGKKFRRYASDRLAYLRSRSLRGACGRLSVVAAEAIPFNGVRKYITETSHNEMEK